MYILIACSQAPVFGLKYTSSSNSNDEYDHYIM